jgi:DNA polymerase/3'-5' exonuclease PolX
MSAKVKYPRAAALNVAKELCDALKPVAERLIVAVTSEQDVYKHAGLPYREPWERL